MEAKLIKTEEGYYLIDDTEIKVDSYYLAWETNYNTPKWVRYVLCSGLNGIKQYNIFASTLDLEEVPKLSLKDCQAIDRGYDLDELAEEWIDANSHKWSNNNNEVGDNYGSFKSGFQKSLELTGDKLFTLDDIYTVFIMGREGMEDKMNRYVTRIHEPTEWDIEIEMEKVKDETKIIGSVKGVKGSGHKITTYKSTPKLDSDGCLILKRI